MPARTNSCNHYKPGDNNVYSDRSGFKMKASDCRMEWNGLLVGKWEWEPRHPQDLVRGVPDDQRPAVSRPGTGNNFVGLTEVSRDDL